jgi:hypothetical protein
MLSYMQLPAPVRRLVQQYDAELAAKLLLCAAGDCGRRLRRLAQLSELLQREAQRRCPHVKLELRDSGDYYSSYVDRYCRLCGQFLG